MRFTTLRSGILRSVAVFGALAFLAAPAGAVDRDVSANAAPGKRIQLAAADNAGWLVFPTKRTGKVEDYSGPLRMRNAVEQAGPQSPALDWLDRWGVIQFRMTR